MHLRRAGQEVFEVGAVGPAVQNGIDGENLRGIGYSLLPHWLCDRGQKSQLL